MLSKSKTLVPLFGVRSCLTQSLVPRIWVALSSNTSNFGILFLFKTSFFLTYSFPFGQIVMFNAAMTELQKYFYINFLWHSPSFSFLTQQNNIFRSAIILLAIICLLTFGLALICGKWQVGCDFVDCSGCYSDSAFSIKSCLHIAQFNMIMNYEFWLFLYFLFFYPLNFWLLF